MDALRIKLRVFVALHIKRIAVIAFVGLVTIGFIWFNINHLKTIEPAGQPAWPLRNDFRLEGDLVAAIEGFDDDYIWLSWKNDTPFLLRHSSEPIFNLEYFDGEIWRSLPFNDYVFTTLEINFIQPFSEGRSRITLMHYKRQPVSGNLYRARLNVLLMEGMYSSESNLIYDSTGHHSIAIEFYWP
ncbi:MAG: hypothetical protein FWC67_01700 [Defluviitaleaceae bacterium]|nr:hypothetical protein [Defluviitaleaceae bacterium]